MTVQTKPYLSPAEYLALERSSEYKSEYLHGQMVAMTGASRKHVLIALNLATGLRRQLEGRPCEVYATDMRVRAPTTGLYTYPDIAVVCGEPQFEDDHEDTLLNPVLIVEVLSSSTESYDRGRKFEHYRTLESLREYLLVSQDRSRVEQFVRQDGTAWLFKEIAGVDQVVSLASVACEIALAEIYEKIALS
jgi:Uma2 family endonuclease